MADAKSSSQDHMIAICSACDPDGKMETVRARIVAECSALSVSWRCLLQVVCFVSLAVACDQVNVHDVDIEETEANVVAMPDRDADDVCSAIESSVQVQPLHARTRPIARMRTLTRRYARTHARLHARVPPGACFLRSLESARSARRARLIGACSAALSSRSCAQGKSTQKDKFNADDAELPAQGEKVRPGLPFEWSVPSLFGCRNPYSRLSVPLLFGYRNPYPDYQCLNTCSDGRGLEYPRGRPPRAGPVHSPSSTEWYPALR
jgi:hypothetical protein